MQTFLPYPNFEQSAKCLDNKRLGNQCYRECKTLLCGGWKHHPASKMWQGYEYALCLYGIALADEMIRRKFGKPVTGPKWKQWFESERTKYQNTGLPPWFGSEEYHKSHRSNLLRKNPQWYGQFGWTEPDDLEYIWPI